MNQQTALHALCHISYTTVPRSFFICIVIPYILFFMSGFYSPQRHVCKDSSRDLRHVWQFSSFVEETSASSSELSAAVLSWCPLVQPLDDVGLFAPYLGEMVNSHFSRSHLWLFTCFQLVRIFHKAVGWFKTAKYVCIHPLIACLIELCSRGFEETNFQRLQPMSLARWNWKQ